MNSLQKLQLLGQSPWQDNISRDQLVSGTLQDMVNDGDITGLTSNPTIFQQAISGSNDYDVTISNLSSQGLDTEAIFYALASEDIMQAADIFGSVYASTGGTDGFVSLEVSPRLAMETSATVSEAIQLWETVDRPNLMIKIPATIPGLEAITMAISAGISVNVTLIFSVDRYSKVIDAYMAGLEKRVESGQDITEINSVASFFISRIDTLVDARLEDMLVTDVETDSMKGRAAIANANLAYKLFQDSISSGRWTALEEKGAHVQRPLWASTSTKDPKYSDVLYVESLIAKDTVNTMPPSTMQAFKDHGNATLGLEMGPEKASRHMEKLSSLGISMDEISAKLETDGVASFRESYEQLLSVIEERSIDLTTEGTSSVTAP
jgi:transaldolase